MLRGYRLAAGAKRLVREQMVILAPAGDIAPTERGILAAADLKRPGEAGIWQMTGFGRMPARGMCGKSAQRQRNGDDTKRAGVSPEPTRVSERFRYQPASSSDRVR